MKNIFWIRKITERFRGLSMYAKLFISFVLPLMLLVCGAILTMGFVFERMYRRELIYGVEQANAQADAFIGNYINGMLFAKKQMQSNMQLREILTAEGFGENADLSEEFREYYALNYTLTVLENGSPNYLLGLYIPSEILYSGNNYHFFSLDELKNQSDFPNLEREMQAKGYGFSVVEENSLGSARNKSKSLALFAPYDESGNHPFILNVRLELSKLQSVLKSASSMEGSMLFLYDGYDRRIIGPKNAEQFEDTLVSKVGDWEVIRQGKREYYAIKREMELSSFYMVTLIPKDKFRQQTSAVFVIAIITSLLMSAIVILISRLLSKYYVGRISTLNRKMMHIGDGTLSERRSLRSDKTDDEMDELDKNFDFMLNEVTVLMKEQYRLGKKISEAQMHALQAQINPHFLYNTLDLINWGALDFGAKNVAKIARDLGQFYRLSLNHGSSVISVEDELKHVESFVRIENVHYENAITLERDVPKELLHYACLNILMQPFVENSIVHGIAEHTEIKRMHIRIVGRKEGEDILFRIEDNGMGVNVEEIERFLQETSISSSRGFGINNVNFRLKLCYGEEYGIGYENLTEGGTRVLIRIKALGKAELEELLG